MTETTLADFVLPFFADLRKIICPDVGRAAAVRAVNHNDIVARKVHALVRASDCRIIPFGDFAEKNSRERFLRKIQLRGDAGNVVRGDVRSEHGREVQDRKTVLVLDRL